MASSADDPTIKQPKFPGSNPSGPNASPTALPTAGGISSGGSPASGGLPLIPSVSEQDLFSDSLISNSGTLELDGRRFKSLGGIPLLARLGQGGMGAVYYGIHLRLRKEVAVKVLPFHLAERNPEFIRRFYREAQIAANIQSPNLVNVFDVNEEGGLSYLVMEYVNGSTAGGHLKELLSLGQPGFPEAAALDVCIAATRGLAAAHAEGVIHRDIKPDNILIPKKRGSSELNFPAAKLNDLGLAHTEGLEKSVTASGACMGTPGFMSPEQCMDAKTCEAPSDVFSMGATLYAMLAGNSPFKVSGSDSALMRVLLDTRDKPHVPIRTVRPQVSEDTAKLIDKCLSKSTQARYPSASELLKALEHCRRCMDDLDKTMPGSPSDIRPKFSASSPSIPQPVRPQNVPLRQPAKSNAGTYWFCALGAIAILVFLSVGGVGLLIAIGRNSKPDIEDNISNKDIGKNKTNVLDSGKSKLNVENFEKLEKVFPGGKINSNVDDPVKPPVADTNTNVPVPPPVNPDDKSNQQRIENERIARQKADEEAKRLQAEQTKLQLEKTVQEAAAEQAAAAAKARAEASAVRTKFLNSLAEAEIAWKNNQVADAQRLLKNTLATLPAIPPDQEVNKVAGHAANVLGDLYTEERDCDFSDVEAVKWYGKSAELDDPLGMSNFAFMYYSGDGIEKSLETCDAWLAKALPGLRKVADSGDPRAQFNLATMLENGLGVEKNITEAQKLFRLAADQGYAKAQSSVGNMYYSGSGVEASAEEAAKWYQKAADQGHATSQLYLGSMYADGTVLKQDTAKANALFAAALFYFRKAAQAGNSHALCCMGDIYALGRGVTKNEYTAADWYGKAAAKGNSDAQYNLSRMLKDGRGTEINLGESARLCLAAANQGNLLAQDAIGTHYANGWGVPKDFEKAREWFQKALDQGLYAAHFHMGGLYEFGSGVEKNVTEAQRLYKIAADGGYPEAQIVMGNMYSFGNWVPRNYATSIKWYALAAKQGNLDAVYNLSRMTAQGLGTQRDQVAAFKGFKSAAELGHAPSMFIVALKLTNGSGVQRNDSQAVLWFKKSREAFQKKSNSGDLTAQGFTLLFTMIDLAGLNMSQTLNPLINLIRQSANNGDANCADVMRTLGE